MPADFFIDPKLRMVFSKVVGTCGRIDALDHMDRLLQDPEFNPDFNQLLDYRDAGEITMSHDEIRQLALRKIFNANSRRAFVAPDDERYGLNRMFATYRELEGEPGIHVFREMSEALAFLSLAGEPDPKFFSRLKLPGA